MYNRFKLGDKADVSFSKKYSIQHERNGTRMVENSLRGRMFIEAIPKN